MGLQLIFVVETNKKCNSDWIYIKETITHFFDYDNSQVRLSVVYMDGKTKYNKKEKEIEKLMNQYNKTGISRVLYCFDCDEYDCSTEAQKFLEKVKDYCKNNNYEFIWFCKDIERVYLHRKVENKQKKKEAAQFMAGRWIQNVNARALKADSFRENTSNILKVLNSYEALTLKN